MLPLFVTTSLQPWAGSAAATSSLERCSQRTWWWLWLERDTQDQSYQLFGLCTQPGSSHGQCLSCGDQGLHLGRVQDGATVALRLVQKEEHKTFQDVSSKAGQDYIFSFLFLAAAELMNLHQWINRQPWTLFIIVSGYILPQSYSAQNFLNSSFKEKTLEKYISKLFQ